MLKLRVFSAIVLVAMVLFILSRGGLYLYFFAVILSLVGLYEYYRAMKHININTNSMFGYISVLIYYFLFLLPIKFARPGFLVAFSVIVLFSYEILKQKHSIPEISLTLLGIAYIPYLFSHLLFIEKMKYGHIIIWLPFITAWFTDTCAYFVGIYFGKVKLCPRVSPKKTVEGALGGVIGCIALSTASGFIINNLGVEIRIVHFILTGFLCGIASQFGDLAASYIKRYTGVKDFGKVIPGHGGIMDRFDSILFTAPVIYYYFLLIGDKI